MDALIHSVLYMILGFLVTYVVLFVIDVVGGDLTNNFFAMWRDILKSLRK